MYVDKMKSHTHLQLPDRWCGFLLKLFGMRKFSLETLRFKVLLHQIRALGLQLIHLIICHRPGHDADTIAIVQELRPLRHPTLVCIPAGGLLWWLLLL